MSALPRPASLALLAASCAAAWWLYGGLATAGHLGFDALPLYAAGADGPLAALTDELMGGRYPDGRFHRPVTSLVFWLDGALGGAFAPGRARILDALIIGVGAWLAGLVAARLTGSGRRRAAVLAASVAALVVCLSPVQLDLVPFAARRAEGLCAIGLTWTLLAAIARDGVRTVQIGAASLFAVWSKETGVLAVPLAVAGAAAAAQDGERLRAGARALAASSVAVGIAAAARLAVLGELGGHAESGLAGLREAPEVARAALSALSGPAGAAVLGGLVLGCAGALAWIGRGGAAALTVGWVAGALLIASLGGRAHAWYAGGAIAPVAVLGGAAAAALFAGPPVARARFAGALGLALAAVAVLGVHAPEERAALEFASREAASQTALLVRTIDGDRTASPDVYVLATTRDGRDPIYLNAPYSLEAAAELLAPDRVVRVVCPNLGLDDARDRSPADLVVELPAPSAVASPR